MSENLPCSVRRRNSKTRRSATREPGGVELAGVAAWVPLAFERNGRGLIIPDARLGGNIC